MPARQGIATAVVDHTRYGKDREAFERALQDVLDRASHRSRLPRRLHAPADTVVRRQWQGRMLNIHPALLPAFKGLHTHERALAAGVKTHGATVHFVSPEMDSGPIIAQAEVPVLDGDTPETLAARVLEAEHRIYPQALRQVAEGRMLTNMNETPGAGPGATGVTRRPVQPAMLSRQDTLPGGRGRQSALTDDLVAGKELGNFLRGGVRRVRAMDRILADRLARGSCGWCPRAALDGSVAPMMSR